MFGIMGAPLVSLSLRFPTRKFSDKLFFVGCLIPIVETIYLLVTRSSFYTYLNGIPITDSKGWFSCVKSLAYSNSWPLENEDWCLRRPFYPLIAAQIFKVTPSLNYYFILCSMIFSVILFFTIIQIRRLFGDVAGWTGILGASGLWLVYGATHTLSEQVGISFGTLALGLFLHYLHGNGSSSLYIGSIFFLVAQLTRPGNVFSYLIPFLLVLLFENQKVRMLIHLGFFVYLPLGVLILLVRKLMGLPNFMHSGNSWATIYGLQFDNQFWSSAYSILPEGVTGEIEVWEFIRKAVVDDIKKHPFNIIESVSANVLNVVDIGPLNLPIFTLLLVFFVYSVYCTSKKSILPRRLLVLIIFVLSTELVTYGVSYNSEPIRTMSTTLIFASVIIVSPISILLRFSWLASRISFSESQKIVSESSKRGHWLVPTSMVFIVSLIVSLVNTSSPRNLYLSSGPENECSYQISISDYPSKFIQQQNLRNILGKNGEWWIDTIANLETGSFVLITSTDRMNNTRDSSVYLRNNLIGDLRRGDRLCVVTSKDQNLSALGFQEGTIIR
jgi:hypothetical protein